MAIGLFGKLGSFFRKLATPIREIFSAAKEGFKQGAPIVQKVSEGLQMVPHPTAQKIGQGLQFVTPIVQRLLEAGG